MDKYDELKAQRDAFQAVTGLKLSRLNDFGSEMKLLVKSAFFAEEHFKEEKQGPVIKSLVHRYSGPDSQAVAAFTKVLSDETASQEAKFAAAYVACVFLPATHRTGVLEQAPQIVMDFFNMPPTADVEAPSAKPSMQDESETDSSEDESEY